MNIHLCPRFSLNTLKLRRAWVSIHNTWETSVITPYPGLFWVKPEKHGLKDTQLDLLNANNFARNTDIECWQFNLLESEEYPPVFQNCIIQIPAAISSVNGPLVTCTAHCITSTDTMKSSSFMIVLLYTPTQSQRKQGHQQNNLWRQC